MQDYANSLFFTYSFFCNFETLMVKYTFCKTIKIHVFYKSAFIHKFKIVLVQNERNLLRKTSLTSMRGI